MRWVSVLLIVLLLSAPAVGAPSPQSVLWRIAEAAVIKPGPLSLSGRSPPGRWRVELDEAEFRCWFTSTYKF